MNFDQKPVLPPFAETLRVVRILKLPEPLDTEAEDPWALLSFLMFVQPRNSSWCWAATVASVVRYFEGRLVCQCAIVGDGVRDCCKGIDPQKCEDLGTVVSDDCNKPGRLEVGLKKFNHFRCCIQKTPKLDVVRGEIDGGNPVLFRQKIGHFVVVSGYERGGGSVLVQDPFNGLTLAPVYSEFAACCTHTYFTKR